jgi:hypothetical protein
MGESYVVAAEMATVLLRLVLHLVDHKTARSLLDQEAIEQANELADEAEKAKFGTPGQGQN